MKKMIFLFLAMTAAFAGLSFAQTEEPKTTAVDTTQAQEDIGTEAPSLDYDSDSD